MNTLPFKQQAIIGIVLGVALSSLAIGSCELLFPAKTLAERIKSAIEGYEWACDHGSNADMIREANVVADLYHQSGDEDNYHNWTITANAIKAMGAVDSRDFELDPALRAQIEGSPKQYPAPRTAPTAHQPPPQKYTYGEKQKMRANFLKSQQGAEQRKIEDDSEAIANKIQKQREANNAAQRSERLKIAIESSPLRPWVTLGGKDAGRARIVAYKEGLVTLEKADGKRIELKESGLSPADKKYLEGWKTQAGL